MPLSSLLTRFSKPQILTMAKPCCELGAKEIDVIDKILYERALNFSTS